VTGQTLSHYRIVEELGGSGMGQPEKWTNYLDSLASTLKFPHFSWVLQSERS
jgi:hypothetical protein